MVPLSKNMIQNDAIAINDSSLEPKNPMIAKGNDWTPIYGVKKGPAAIDWRISAFLRDL